MISDVLKIDVCSVLTTFFWVSTNNRTFLTYKAQARGSADIIDNSMDQSC